MMKASSETIVNISAAVGEIFPAGISRFIVLGFLASIERSRYLLKAMAVLRAKTMHNNMYKRIMKSKGFSDCALAIKKPMNAKGNAKTVWANLTREKYFRMEEIKLIKNLLL